MGDYYFTCATLPTLRLDGELEISFAELMTLFSMNLSRHDLEKVHIVRRVIDLRNVLQLLNEEPCDPRGNLSIKELEEALLNKTHLPDYVFEILDNYDNRDDQIAHFYEIIARFFSEEVARTHGFLRKYLEFERQWRLCMTGYRAKKLGRDLSKELQFEDFTDPLVAFLLAQKDVPTFEFPYEYRDLGERLQGVDEPADQHHVMTRYRFEKVVELIDAPEFTIDTLILYMVQLIILEDLASLNESAGGETLAQIKG